MHRLYRTIWAGTESDLHHHLNTLNIRARELDRQTVPDDLLILADTLAFVGSTGRNGTASAH